MTQTQELDFAASIKRLAEARIRCPNGAWAYKGEPDQTWLCSHSAHGYEGYYAPFAALRAKCYDEAYPEFCAQGEALCNDPESCTNWVPEPDEEKACWRVMKVLRDIDRHSTILTVFLNGGEQTEEAVLRAAEAWLGEKL